MQAVPLRKPLPSISCSHEQTSSDHANSTILLTRLLTAITLAGVPSAPSWRFAQYGDMSGLQEHVAFYAGSRRHNFTVACMKEGS